MLKEHVAQVKEFDNVSGPPTVFTKLVHPFHVALVGFLRHRDSSQQPPRLSPNRFDFKWRCIAARELGLFLSCVEKLAGAGPASVKKCSVSLPNHGLTQHARVSDGRIFGLLL